MMGKLRIGIVGAGPGGLTLARILYVNGIEAVVFEREASTSDRPQGGSLDMHAKSGQYAIACAGLTTDFRRIARYEDQESRIYDKDGRQVFLEEDLTGKDRPEVDRGQLRQMLLDSLPDGVVRWGSELVAAMPCVDGGFELELRGGVRERFDLIVGADGTWSRIRPLVSDARPVYSGVTFVEMGIDDVDVGFPELARLAGRGLTFAVGERKAIIAHRDSGGHLGIYASLRVPEGWTGSGDLRAYLLAQFEGWDEGLRRLIAESGERMVPRPIYALPVGHRWENQAGVTLLGDAAHVMSPFGGDGANLAMWDGADLALGLVSGSDWRGAVRDYEERMFGRAEACAAGAAEAIEEVFSEDGLEHIVAAMRGHGG
ncbi:FAD-dependent oxidoreductase [Granulicella tundricola]|nr:FAD-dependent monooxygenase [Granulicella tundricola]